MLVGARILVIDDHRDLVENLTEILEDEGAEVRHAASGAQALELARRPFDVALLDVRLPDATGHALLPQLRAAGDGKGEVLLITGNASLEDAIAAVTGGAYAYVLKPFDPEDLLHHVERALRQVRSTREAEALRRALEEREASLSTLVDTVQALLLVLDGQGHILQANHAVSLTTGVPAAELIGMNWVDSFVPPSDVPVARGVLERLLSGAGTVSHETRMMGRHSEREQNVRWVSWRSSALRDQTGELRIYASGLDTTEVRQLERRTRLAEKLAAVGTLSAGLAHEIRNPLNAASLQLRLLDRRCRAISSDHRIIEPLHLVQEELQRLSRLVREFLSFARPTDVHPEPVDLRALVDHVMELEKPAAEERHTALSAQLPDEPVQLVGDREKLQQVVVNLVHNGLDAAGPGGHVVVRVGQDGGGVSLVVADDGPGIPEEHQNRIFEPFFSTKPGGTGLGMAIVHSLVALHGGDISVHCEEGTEVRVAIPYRPPFDDRSAAR